MTCSLMGQHAEVHMNANLARTIEYLYDKASSAVKMNGSTGEWFRTEIGIRQECLLFPTLFNDVSSLESKLKQ